MNNGHIIEKAVQELVNNDEMFTSIDISNSIKKKGTWVRNVEVAAWLRQNFYQNDTFLDYGTTPIEVDNGTRTATLYHPDWKNPEDYTDVNQRALTPSEVNKIKQTNDTSNDIVSMLDSTDEVMSKVIRSKERIKIPGSMIRKMGYNPGDKVPPDVVESHKTVPGRLIVNKDYRFSIPRSVINWGTDPVKVILTKNNKITFEKA